MKQRRAAFAIAIAALLSFTAPAQAIECKDFFSEIRQSDPLAPFVVGDSVTVPAGDYLGEQGFAVDAVACRTFAQGLEVIATRSLPDLVVVALGSNAGVSGAELDRALDLVGPSARLMLVLPKELGGAPDPDGRLMRAFAEAHRDQVTILDWPAYSSGQRGWFASDGLHLTSAGAQGFARMIEDAVEFAPAPEAEPPPLASVWRALGDTIVAVVAPGLRLLAGVVGDVGELTPPDL